MFVWAHCLISQTSVLQTTSRQNLVAKRALSTAVFLFEALPATSELHWCWNCPKVRYFLQIHDGLGFTAWVNLGEHAWVAPAVLAWLDGMRTGMLGEAIGCQSDCLCIWAAFASPCIIQCKLLVPAGSGPSLDVPGSLCAKKLLLTQARVLCVGRNQSRGKAHVICFAFREVKASPGKTCLLAEWGLCCSWSFCLCFPSLMIASWCWVLGKKWKGSKSSAQPA